MKNTKVVQPNSTRLPYDLGPSIARFETATGITESVRKWMIESCRSPRVGMLERFVFPNIYVPDKHYLYSPIVKEKPGRRGFSPEVTSMMLAGRTPAEAVGDITLVTNPLAWTDWGSPTPPSERAINAGSCIYTCEIDTGQNPGIDPVGLALKWHLSGKLRNHHNYLLRYRDYIGYALVYSGRSSPHIHYLFDLRHLRRDLASVGNSSYADHCVVDIPDTHLYGHYQLNWDRIAESFRTHVDPDVTLDSSLRTWIQPRRSLWGLRVVDADKPHPWGFAPGTSVPQVVLVETLRTRARGATEWFHDPVVMASPVDSTTPRGVQSRATVVVPGHLDAPISRISQRLIGAPYPKFSHHEIANGLNRLKFLNTPSDRDPDSFMVGRSDRIALVGNHDLTHSPVLGASADRIVETASIMDARKLGDDHPLVDSWRKEVITPEQIRPWFNMNMVEMVLAGKRTWIRSLEGAGKTTSLLSPASMDLIHDVILADETSDDEYAANRYAAVAVAFPSYDQAREKHDEFNRVCYSTDSIFEGFLFRSMYRLYRDCLEGDVEIAREEAFKRGDSSIWRLVRKNQPDVWSRMWADRERLQSLLARGKVPVLFTVLDVAEGYGQGSLGRMFYAPSMTEAWFGEMDIDERTAYREKLLAESKLEMVIVDEVSYPGLIDIDAGRQVELTASANRFVQGARATKTHEIYRAFRRWGKRDGVTPAELSFSDFEKIVRIEYQQPERVTVDANIERPFDGSGHIYAEMHGAMVYMKPKSWWENFTHVAFLTTEALPTVLARRCVQDVLVFDLDGDVVADSAELLLDKRCNKTGLLGLQGEMRRSHPNAIFISNMLDDATSHIAARGLNGLASDDIVSMYTSPSPSQYRDWAAINTWLKIKDAVRLAIVDQINQTIGRNRGLRSAGGRHWVSMSPRFYFWLSAHYAAYGRYPLVKPQAIAALIDDAEFAVAA